MKRTSIIIALTLFLSASTAFARVPVQVNVGANANANASTTANDRGELASEAHRSAVASFVQSLRAVANRDGGIGAEVRAVAKSQNDSDATTTDAIAKVESRSAFKTFLLGTDWESIGMLRSQIARDSADVKRLQAAHDKTTDVTVRADLGTQIDVLKAEQAKIEAFVTLHESTFSLFGWFTRLFVSADAGE
jgi:hypothetical protein